MNINETKVGRHVRVQSHKARRFSRLLVQGKLRENAPGSDGGNSLDRDRDRDRHSRPALLASSDSVRISDAPNIEDNSSTTSSVRSTRNRNRGCSRVLHLAGYALIAGLLTACGGSGEVTPHPTLVATSQVPSEPVPNPTPTYPISEGDRLLHDLSWYQMVESERVQVCESLALMGEDWAVNYLMTENPTAQWDVRAQVILMNEECNADSNRQSG